MHRLRRHPLARALRVDKLTLAALEATLRGPEPPARAMLHIPTSALRARAEALAADLGVEVIDCTAAVGGGGAPGVELASAGLALPVAAAAALRAGRDPVVARVEHGRCVVDLRSVDPADDARLAAAIRRAVAAP